MTKDAKRTREFAIMFVLIDYTGKMLTPPLVEEIVSKVVKEMETGACSWAFKEEK